ncbi:unnamed protein product [Ceratitis capitata]|uniref:(Mediterranean fruit fly) hypothetical protein n=1 Tax=Ceratitis capitata TaxID=7213 RepID=A0A811VMF1_CERCA|nr:unnamed protein product [Ceratitis capitata]
MTTTTTMARGVWWVAVGGPMTQLHAGESANWRTKQKMHNTNTDVRPQFMPVCAVSAVRKAKQIQTQSEKCKGENKEVAAEEAEADIKANSEAAQ